MLSQGNPRMPSEYRHMSTGSVNIPSPHASNGNGTSNVNGNGNGAGSQPGGAMTRFDGPRSPPGRQNTSHVPCKFFRQGACQAGSACPFSHDPASTSDNICKYFAKGNCKFGPKCANIHVLPDGRRVNYKHGGPIGAGHLNIGGRLPTADLYHPATARSALTNSFISASAAPTSPYTQYLFQNQEDTFSPLAGRQQSIDINVPAIDTIYASHPTSQYGSPRDEDINRSGIGLSPVALRGLSVLDAQLPASFDSNGVSWIARNGPIASSVPAKFGLDSPPGSLGAAKDSRTSEALKNLHNSAFGDDTRDRFNGIPASPPMAPTDEYFGKSGRVMHSARYTKQKVMSASLPKAADQDWPEQFPFEEEFLPETLKDLMTPQEKARRGSRHADDESRPFGSGTGTPNHDIKFGSPSNASPSRWNPYFQHKENEDRARTSAFGHVGSPLRNSTLHPGATPSVRPIGRPSISGDSSPYLASPPRTSSGSMSILSQRLKGTHLSGTESGLYPGRSTSNPIGVGSRSGYLGERQVSSSSIGGGSGRLTTPIDEEQGDFVFSMEEDEKTNEKRNSGGWPYQGSNLRPQNGTNGSSKNGTLNGHSVDGMFGAR